MNNEELSKPWYKYWAVWLIIVLPLTAVVASGVTVYIAIVYKQSSVDTNYYKEGVAQKERTDKFDKAKQMQIVATLFIAPKDNTVKLIFTKNIEDNYLIVKFQHSLIAIRDFYLNAKRIAKNSYSFTIPKEQNINQTDWDIIVGSEKNNWQIKARLKKNTTSVILQ